MKLFHIRCTKKIVGHLGCGHKSMLLLHITSLSEGISGNKRKTKRTPASRAVTETGRLSLAGEAFPPISSVTCSRFYVFNRPTNLVSIPTEITTLPSNSLAKNTCSLFNPLSWPVGPTAVYAAYVLFMSLKKEQLLLNDLDSGPFPASCLLRKLCYKIGGLLSSLPNLFFFSFSL